MQKKLYLLLLLLLLLLLNEEVRHLKRFCVYCTLQLPFYKFQNWYVSRQSCVPKNFVVYVWEHNLFSAADVSCACISAFAGVCEIL